jgi:hypothetical protein
MATVSDALLPQVDCRILPPLCPVKRKFLFDQIGTYEFFKPASDALVTRRANSARSASATSEMAQNVIPARVRIVPQKTGTFEFHCDNFCGIDPENMNGTIM